IPIKKIFPMANPPEAPQEQAENTTPEGRIAAAVFEALKKDLISEFDSQLMSLRTELATAITRVAQMELLPLSRTHSPKINPPEIYDGKSKVSADQYMCQVTAAAEFEIFCNDRQKVLWAQSYLTGSAHDWSCIITKGSSDPTLNPRRCQWDAWLEGFKATFCTQDPAQDALTCIGALQQGSKTITEYCTAFLELKGKLGKADAESEYVKDRFWKGLCTPAMETLVNTKYKTVEEA
ncbi:hypothetical protein H0H87_012781, partial [Tephrocybe sp. NHM501043]